MSTVIVRHLGARAERPEQSRRGDRACKQSYHVRCLSTDRGGLTPATGFQRDASFKPPSTLAGGHRSGSHRSVGAATTAATHLLRRDMTELEYSTPICAWLGQGMCRDEGRPARPADQRKMPRQSADGGHVGGRAALVLSGR